MAYEYDLSDAPTFRCEFAVDNTLTDPTTITLTIITPAKVSTDYTYGAAQITKVSTGVYTKIISLTERGVWYYRWVGTGACVAASEGTITVRA